MSDDFDPDAYLGWSVYWIEQWSQFISRCNWYTFHPIKIEIEHEPTMGGVEATVIILGLGVRVRYNYAVTERLSTMMDDLARLRKETE